MSEFVYQTAIITLMVVGGWVLMALGAYLIGILCFRLPFFFWVRSKPPVTSGIATRSKPRHESEARGIAA